MEKTLILPLILFTVGGTLLSGLTLPRIGVWSKIRSISHKVEELGSRRWRVNNARDWVDRINGTQQEGFVAKTFADTRRVYASIGQPERYQRRLLLALFCGAAGCALGLMLHNITLALVLAVGCYLVPLWLSRFAGYRYDRFVNDELETALSLITTSYLRSGDILSAVRENLGEIREPVHTVFSGFVNGLTFVDANAAAGIERMKQTLDNSLFREWCDVLILCQDNHLLRNALPPIVAKFSALKAQQEANETRMTDPLRYAGMMTAIVAGFCPLLRLINTVWYENLMYTVAGQTVLAGAAIAVFVTLDRAIRLSEPIAYEV